MNEKLIEILQSPLREIFEEVRALKRAGKAIADFTVGEPTWPLRSEVSERVADHVRAEGRWGYPPAQGLPELREALARDAAGRGIQCAVENIIITCGAKQAIRVAMQALLRPGDGVAVFSPYYPSYVIHGHLASARPVIVRTDESHLPDIDDLRRKMDGTCRMIVVNTPCNPTGAVYPAEILDGIAKVALRHRCWILFDECYRLFVYGNRPHVSLASNPEVKDLLVTVDSFSKSHAMAGWRLGYAIAPSSLAKAMALLVGEDTSGASTAAQWAGLYALEVGAAVAPVIARLRTNRDFLCDLISRYGMALSPPDGAFYCFPTVTDFCRARGIPGTRQLVRHLMACGVAATPGDAFGSREAVRFSFCRAEGFAEDVEALEQALEQI
jgi:aspartate/methionine/tyrosine aminotransferase